MGIDGETDSTICPQQAIRLFKLLDLDGSGSVEPDEPLGAEIQANFCGLCRVTVRCLGQDLRLCVRFSRTPCRSTAWSRSCRDFSRCR